jgi:hypothetical protein
MSPEEIAASALAGMDTPSSPNENNHDIAATVKATTNMSESNTCTTTTSQPLLLAQQQKPSNATTATALKEVVEETNTACDLEAETNSADNEKLVMTAVVTTTTADKEEEVAADFSVTSNNNSSHTNDVIVNRDLNHDTQPETTNDAPVNASVAPTNQTAGTTTGNVVTNATNKPKRRGPKPKVKLPVEPRLIQSIPKRKEYVNHSYSDFSTIMNYEYVRPTNIDEMSFVEKIHDILSKPEYENYISWKHHGRAFGITIPSMFEKIVCPIYFQHKRYSSFLRQLNNYGFKHLIKDGPNRNCYYHEVRIYLYLYIFVPCRTF